MKKGFTLIELLAVIVILAIIALIATPIVLNIIKESRDSATLRSAENYMDGVVNAIAKTNMQEDGTFSPNSCEINEKGNLIECTGHSDEIIVDVDKEKPKDGFISFNRGKVEDVTLIYNNDRAVIEAEEGKLELLIAPESVAFATDSWETIKVYSNMNVYNVGDEKEIELDVDGDEVKTSYTLRIANLPSEEEKTEGCGTEGFSETACGFVVEFKDIISKYRINKLSTNEGGWPASQMRIYIGGYTNDENNFVEGTIYKSLPESLKKALINTYVVSGHQSNDAGTREDGNFESIDKLYLLSAKEVWGEFLGKNDTAKEKTRQLDYYESASTHEELYIISTKQYNGSASDWWMRSIGYGVSSSGSTSIVSANAYLGVAPAFRVR